MTLWILALLLLVFFAYFGYPLWLAVSSRWRYRPWRQETLSLSVSVIIAARNEAGRIRQRLENIREQTGLTGPVSIIVVSDGSTDGTDAAVEAVQSEWRAVGCPVSLELIRLNRHGGKARALNAGVARARGDVLVFADARQRFAPDAMARLLENFAAGGVGAVSGELRFAYPGVEGEAMASLGLYWRLETFVRERQAATASVMGVTGAIYALRRDLFPRVPASMLVDDLYIPLRVMVTGKRVVLDRRAVAWDQLPEGAGNEYLRKLRTLTGVWQCVPQLGALLAAGQAGMAGRFVAHKLSRLLVPWALLALPPLCLLSGQWGWQVFGVMQVAGYGLLGLPQRWVPARLRALVRTGRYFVLLNRAAAVSLFRVAGAHPGNLWPGSQQEEAS